MSHWRTEKENEQLKDELKNKDAHIEKLREHIESCHTVIDMAHNKMTALQKVHIDCLYEQYATNIKGG